jgi:hypothetical protein
MDPLADYDLIEDGNGQIRYIANRGTILFLGAEAVPRVSAQYTKELFTHALMEVISPPRTNRSYAPIRSAIERTVPPQARADLFMSGIPFERPQPAFDPSSNAAVEIVEFEAPLEQWNALLVHHQPSRAFVELKAQALRDELPLAYFGFIGIARGTVYAPEGAVDYRRRPLRVSFDGAIHSLAVDRTPAFEERLGDLDATLDALVQRIRRSLDPEREPDRFPVPVTNPKGASIGLAAAEIETLLSGLYPASPN